MTNLTNRRSFISIMGGAVSALAGCAGGDSGVVDSDGDGVIDSEDYAPQDSSVQSKSDVKEAAPATSQTTTKKIDTTATETFSPTGTTNTNQTSTTPTSPSTTENTLSVPSDPFEGRTFTKSYSSSQVETIVTSHPEIPSEKAKIVTYTYTYPRGKGVAYGVSEPFQVPKNDEQRVVTTELTEGEIKRDTRLHHMIFAIPADLSFEEVKTEDLTFVFETDPFRVTDNEINRDPPSYVQPTKEQSSFSRINKEGMYSLKFSGSTKGQDWDIDFIVWKSAYAESRNRPRGRGYDEYVSLAQKSGFAGELASLLENDAEANEFTDKRMQVEMVIDFVQSLPYVSDDVSSGFNQYTQTLQETIVEARGDCEDTSILLAAVLQAEPFGYDTVLIAPPNHMAAGVYGTDLPGTYWDYNGRKYYYIETTGEGWGIGDLPEVYKEEKASVYQV